MHKGDLYTTGNFYIPDDLESRESELESACMKRNLPATENKFRSLTVLYGQVSLYHVRPILSLHTMKAYTSPESTKLLTMDFGIRQSQPGPTVTCTIKNTAWFQNRS